MLEDGNTAHTSHGASRECAPKEYDHEMQSFETEVGQAGLGGSPGGGGGGGAYAIFTLDFDGMQKGL